MRRNVGGGDRILRLAAGGGLVTMGGLTHGWLRKMSLLLGGIGVATGSFRFCPINQLAHRNTAVIPESVTPAI